MVDFGLVTAWRFAAWPTRTSPFFVNATIEGVVLAPSLLGMTVASPPSMTAMQLFVVPKSIPSTFAIVFFFLSIAVDCLRNPIDCNQQRY